jgi:hypothetical protein
MPKIPTFTAQTRISSDIADIKTQYQAPLDGGPISQLVPAMQKLNDYYVAQQDLTEKIEAKKEIFIVKGEADKFLKQEENNYNETNAIQNFTNKWDQLTKQKLDGVSNLGVRNRIKQNLDLEYGDYVYNIKKQSFKALETESTNTYNSEQNTLAAKYQTYKDNPIIKAQVKRSMLDNATDFVKSMQLSPIDEINKRNAVERDLFLLDLDPVIGTANAKENFAKMDEAFGATRFIKDDELSKALFITYKEKISKIAVKGDPNSDYDRAIQIANEFETLQRANGQKVLTGKLQSDWSDFRQNLLSESIDHEQVKIKILQGAEVNEYSVAQKDILQKTFYNSNFPDLSGQRSVTLAKESGFEYDQRFNQFLTANPNASKLEKKLYSKELTTLLIDKYRDADIAKITTFDLQRNKFNIVREKQQIADLISEYNIDPTQPNQLKTLAKLNGYKYKNGNPDVNGFLKEYQKVIQSRQKE